MARPSRLTTFPIEEKPAWDMYKLAIRNFWTADEINIGNDDKQQYRHDLSDGQRHAVNFVVGFFAASDGIVNIGIGERFKQEFAQLEVKYFYALQEAMENIHAETYSIILDTLISDISEREQLLNAATEIPTIAAMSAFMMRCIESSEPLSVRLFRMACVEGILFTGCFCLIYWLQTLGKMPGLAHSNELIARDEALHAQFAVYLMGRFDKVDITIIYEIIDEIIALAADFVSHAIPEPMQDMNQERMTQYIKYIADNLLVMAGYPAKYRVNMPFRFMEQLMLKNRSNFFERRVAEYSKPKTGGSGTGFTYDF